jgi:LEA14-like dessication related protein
MPPRLPQACLALFLALILGAALPACGVRQLTRGEIQPPKISFQGLAFGRPTRGGWPLALVLLLTNPNDQALDLKGYDYELWLEGKSVAQGASDDPVNLPPRGQTVAQVPILVNLPALLGLLPLLIQPEPPPLHYQVSGGFRLSEVLAGLVRIPFRFQGQVTPKEGLDALRLHLRRERRERRAAPGTP